MKGMIIISYFILLVSLCSYQLKGQSDFTNILLHSSSINQSEPTITIDPNNTSNLSIVSNLWHGNTNQLGAYYSTNGLNNWTPIEPLSSQTRVDPSAAYNSKNDFVYLSYVLTNTSHNPNDLLLEVIYSSNHGANWSASTQVSESYKFADKPFIAIDNNPSSQYYGNIYTSWTYTGTSNNLTVFSKSSDAGAHFSAPLNIASTGTEGSNIAVGPNGYVYVVWSIGEPNCTGIGFSLSTDGGTSFSSPVQITSVYEIGQWKNPDYCLKSTSSNPYGVRVNSFPSMAVDPNNGVIYVTWADNRNGNPDIFLIKSTDQGATWSSNSPTKINNDNTTSDQWFPWINVTQDGAINVVFYDSRNDPNNLSTMVYIARSTDGGSSFANYQVSDVSFRPTAVPGAAAGYMGDYIGMVSTSTDAYPCWMDNRTGTYQLYTADVQFKINVTADQLDAGGTRLTGTTIGKWEGGPNFIQDTLGSTPLTFPQLEYNSTLALEGYQQLVENNTQKYYEWNTDPDVTNFHLYTVKPKNNNFTSHFNGTTSGVTVQNSLLDDPALSLSGNTNVGFSDPWLIDYPDPNYGNTKRNEGVSAPLKSRTSPFYPNLTKNYNGDVYQGIFLNQDYNIPGNPYYQVSFPSNQTISVGGTNHSLYFQSWIVDSGANVQNSLANPTPVVFTRAGGTVTANVKASQLSGDASAYSNSSQRKLVRTPDGTLHMVYSSMGHVWYEISTNNGSSWSIMNNGKPLDNGAGKCPSIDYYGNVVGIVFQQQSGSYYTIQLQAYYGSGSNYIFGTSATVYTEQYDAYSINANPNISWGYNAKFMVTWERKTNVFPICSYGINYAYGSLSYNNVTLNGNGFVSGTDNNSVNASVYSNKSDYNDGFQIAYEQDNYLKYIYYCRTNISSTWNVTTTAVSNISSGDSYYLNYRPSVIGMPDGSAKVCWIGDYSGNGSMVNIISRDLSQSNSFFSNGNNVKSASMNLTNDNTNCYFSWSNYGGGTSYTDQFANISTPFINKTLNTNGQDVQLSNGASANNMYVSTYYPFTAPYYFVTSNNLGSFPKANPNSISSGKGVVVVKGNAQFSYSLGDVTVDNNKISFVRANDSTNNNILSNINNLITEPFTLSNNSDFNFSVMTGLIDSAAAMSALGNNDYIDFKVELIDDATGAVIGTLNDARISSSNLSPDNVSSFKVNTKGMGGKQVKMNLTVSTNIDNPEYYVIERYSADGNVTGKFSADTKEISVQGSAIVKNYALNQNYPNPFNPTTIINYQIPKEGIVTIKIFDELGKEVKTLVNAYKSQGRYSVSFDASELSSGVYFYQLRAGDFISIKKMVLLK